MLRADLHVHSKASKRPSEWFLQKVGAQESYTDIDTLYATAKQYKMDLVTITDHNTIEGVLQLTRNYPEDTFISVEFTTYFPENRCKIHVLVYDITPEQFEALNLLRENIYQFRDYLRNHDVAYSVAHGFYSVNKRLDIQTIEKLMLLFDIFEGMNGARNTYYNQTWQDILNHLTKEKIQFLQDRYHIDPISSDPWIKGFTGGSDDHACLFIGQTATVSPEASTKAQFIQSIKDKKTLAVGRCNDFKSFAFSIYKIFCDYSSDARKNATGGILSVINSVIFEEKQSRLKQWITLRKVKKGKEIKDKIALKFFEDIYHWSQNPHLDMEAKIENSYHSMGLLLDEFFKTLLDSFVNDFSKGDVGKLFQNLMSSLPALFISIPFFSSLKHLSQDREMIHELKEEYVGQQNIRHKRILWFTDTFIDQNGVSVTLNRFRKQCEKRDLNICFAACVPEKKQIDKDSGHILYLPCIDSVTPEFYPSYTLHFPSLLASMEMIYDFRPEKIMISTPGPVGVLGMVMASMLGIECTSIYHTDFAAQAELVFKDEALADIIKSLVNRFYAFSTHIKVPTQEYIKILEQQNYAPEKMSLFKRGIHIKPFNPDPSWKTRFRKKNRIQKGTSLLWAGRVSQDKNIDYLLDTYLKACETIPDLNLILCGTGPDLDHYKTKFKSCDRIHFTGYINTHALELYYEFCDLFVFPSTTDTFGMVILEAQSHGLPALVTDIGGPQEIICAQKTGFAYPLSDQDLWVNTIKMMHSLKTENPNEFALMKSRCQNHIQKSYNWTEALFDILNETPLNISGNHHPHGFVSEKHHADMNQRQSVA
ncbi:MAG: glycosyltransferase [Proteobacteria bacterium]|nr:glycosyltransferase [Pseudomonadota bacterium]MBU1387604.1 glycosyltransferase [Pseudomonadota bacterium]MBU1544195.1 glycosyltransferase [Pseudomonadota bacterium]